MSTKETRLVRELSEWFHAHRRPLPWREVEPGPWGILVVEVMSQQTPISRVQPVWEEWMARWPTPAALAAASPAEVIRAWGRMGYPRRALQLQRAAAVIATEFGGRVPRTEEELLRLPGVGAYTAAAVVAFAHGERAVVLDTNIRRVLTRTFDGVALPPAHIRAAERARAQEIVPREPAASVVWNAAVMEFGALVCTARAPACGACPVTACRWREAGFPQNAPARRTQKWAGTDRQVRGAIMGCLRASAAPVEFAALERAVRGAHPWVGNSQLERALAALVEDSLVEQVGGGGDGVYRLPH